jgi:hypothetical protein
MTKRGGMAMINWVNQPEYPPSLTRASAELFRVFGGCHCSDDLSYICEGHRMEPDRYIPFAGHWPAVEGEVVSDEAGADDK